MITNLQKLLGGTNVKRYYSIFLIGIGLIIYLLLFSPFNVYHWANAKNIIISSPYIIEEEPTFSHFEDYIGHIDDIETVRYLGRNSYFVSLVQGKQYVSLLRRVQVQQHTNYLRATENLELGHTG
jgi:hypothetical protein